MRRVTLTALIVLPLGLAAYAIQPPVLPPAAPRPQATPEPLPPSPVAKPTFAGEIAPLLYKNCATCHHAGDIGPFSLMSYSDARKRAKLIAAVTESRTMPPWKPLPGYGNFKHERRLTGAEIALLKRWAETGAPGGNAKNAPSPPVFPEGWTLGKPDLILEMPQPYAVRAEGRDDYRSFVIPVKLREDKYVKAVEFQPGNRRVVHHATVTFDSSGKAREREAEEGGPGGGYSSLGGFGFLPSGALPGYVPGDRAQLLDPDIAWKLPQKVDIVFGMHYHSIGTPETDKSRLGIYFADRKPERIPSVILMNVANIEIPAGKNNHREVASYTIPVEVELLGVGPHMHLIGKTCRIFAELPDGTFRPLLAINDWDFQWQGTYDFTERIRLPKGTKIWAEWTHDNSAANPANPNSPPKFVKSGEQSADEMAAAWLGVLVKDDWDNLKLWGATLGHFTESALRPAQK